MEITWYGQGCVRLRGREGSIVADAYPSIVGPTGRGLTADIATYSHLDPSQAAGRNGNGRRHVDEHGVPASLEKAFRLDGPGEYEIHDVLVTGVRTSRDEVKGAERGRNVAFVYQLDGLHVVHLGDLGHTLNEEHLGEIGAVHVACVPIGGHLTAARAAEVVAQLDAGLVVPLPMRDTDEENQSALERFLHEMAVKELVPQARLSVTISTVPEETTVVLLEQRGRQ